MASGCLWPKVIVSGAPSNDDFRQIEQLSWLTFTRPGIRMGHDRYGAATAHVSQESFRAIRSTCEWASVSADAQDFFTRIAVGGYASSAQRAFVDGMRTQQPKASSADSDNISSSSQSLRRISQSACNLGTLRAPNRWWRRLLQSN